MDATGTGPVILACVDRCQGHWSCNTRMRPDCAQIQKSACTCFNKMLGPGTLRSCESVQVAALRESWRVSSSACRSFRSADLLSKDVKDESKFYRADKLLEAAMEEIIKDPKASAEDKDEAKKVCSGVRGGE